MFIIFRSLGIEHQSDSSDGVTDHLNINVGHHRSLSSGHSAFYRSHSSTHLSSLDKRRSGSSMVSFIISMYVYLPLEVM